MDFISNSNTLKYRINYNPIQSAYSTYDYRASNESTLDNSLSCKMCNYTIHPKIDITYAQPYNTGKCVSKQEKKQEPFNLQTKTIQFFSDLVK